MRALDWSSSTVPLLMDCENRGPDARKASYQARRTSRYSFRKSTTQPWRQRAVGARRSTAHLVPIVGSELTFALRTKGRQHEGESRHVDTWPGFEVLREVAVSSGDDLIAIATGLDEDELVALPYQGKTYEYPKSFFLLHAIEHGIEHRTEIKVTLALIGIETPDLDGWFFAPVAGYGREIVNRG